MAAPASIILLYSVLQCFKNSCVYFVVKFCILFEKYLRLVYLYGLSMKYFILVGIIKGREVLRHS